MTRTAMLEELGSSLRNTNLLKKGDLFTANTGKNAFLRKVEKTGSIEKFKAQGKSKKRIKGSFRPE